MIKKVLFILAYTLYIFFVLGLFFHTSAHPQIFHKYTYKYLLLLILLILFFPIFLWLMYFLGSTSIFRLKEKKIVITPVRKLVIYILVFLIVIVLPAEIFLRIKYKNTEANAYAYTIENFNPFLQLQLTNAYTTNINSAGFRAPEISIKKPPGTYRIFVLGGSTVLNRGTPYAKIATTLLEQKLQKKFPNKKIEVINAGVDGYTSEHSLILYLFKIKDYHPDLIIMWHGINDLYYSCVPADRAYGTYKPDYSNFLSFDGNMVFNYFKTPPIIAVKLVSYDFFLKFLNDNWYTDLTHYIQAHDTSKEFYTAKTRDKQYELKDFPSLGSYSRNVQSLINATQADHVQLMLGNQPYLYNNHMTQAELNKIDFQIYCIKDGKYPTVNSLKKGIQSFNDVTKEIAQKNNVPFFDLAAAIPKNLDYFTDDVHYTDKANSKIANTLYNFIISQNIIH